MLLGERLGSGTNGEVHESQITIQQEPPLTITAAAKKILPLTMPELFQLVPGSVEHQRTIDDFLTAVRLMQQNKHPHIVLSFGYTTSPSNGWPCSLLLERASTTLQSLLWPRGQKEPMQALKSKDVYWYGTDILNGLDYLHRQQIVHRAIKPDNILMFEHGGTLIAKLGDFGLGQQMERTFIHGMGGAVFYMAPEGLRFNNPMMRPESDIYSFGIVFIGMAVGCSPEIFERSEENIRDLMGTSIFCNVALGTVQAEWNQRWSAAVALDRLRVVRADVYRECGHCQGAGRAVWE